ncbi:hypothetical protein SCLARK_00413 [Spiroplasma clarkii]|uniref:hypothetical protein n=1 Tax=Spiroplasma clarkii TaxID=2139 RepID=UPI000B552BDE|nr:hypothetical protein [Spiroplasma clarkii]ARU91135.1 hypothetical protein SCLARK_00413 [Spiroplasma clarkii]
MEGYKICKNCKWEILDFLDPDVLCQHCLSGTPTTKPVAVLCFKCKNFIKDDEILLMRNSRRGVSQAPYHDKCFLKAQKWRYAWRYIMCTSISIILTLKFW